MDDLSPLSRAKALLAAMRSVGDQNDSLYNVRAPHESKTGAGCSEPVVIKTPDALAQRAIGRQTHRAVVARARTRVRRSLDTTLHAASSRPAERSAIYKHTSPSPVLGAVGSPGAHSLDSNSGSSSSSEGDFSEDSSGDEGSDAGRLLLQRTLQGSIGPTAPDNVARSTHTSPSLAQSPRSAGSKLPGRKSPARATHSVSFLSSSGSAAHASGSLVLQPAPRNKTRALSQAQHASHPHAQQADALTRNRKARVQLAGWSQRSSPYSTREESVPRASRTPRPVLPAADYLAAMRETKEAWSRPGSRVNRPQPEVVQSLISPADATRKHRRWGDASGAVVHASAARTAGDCELSPESVRDDWDRLRLFLANLSIRIGYRFQADMQEIARLVDSLQARSGDKSAKHLARARDTSSLDSTHSSASETRPPMRIGSPHDVRIVYDPVPPSGNPPPLSPVSSVEAGRTRADSAGRSAARSVTVSPADSSTSSFLPSGADSAGTALLEEGIMLADFQGDPSYNQISVAKDARVRVVQRFASGWWFVVPEPVDTSMEGWVDRGGYVPGTYLATLEMGAYAVVYSQQRGESVGSRYKAGTLRAGTGSDRGDAPASRKLAEAALVAGTSSRVRMKISADMERGSVPQADSPRQDATQHIVVLNSHTRSFRGAARQIDGSLDRSNAGVAGSGSKAASTAPCRDAEEGDGVHAGTKESSAVRKTPRPPSSTPPASRQTRNRTRKRASRPKGSTMRRSPPRTSHSARASQREVGTVGAGTPPRFSPVQRQDKDVEYSSDGSRPGSRTPSPPPEMPGPSEREAAETKVSRLDAREQSTDVSTGPPGGSSGRSSVDISQIEPPPGSASSNDSSSASRPGGRESSQPESAPHPRPGRHSLPPASRYAHQSRKPKAAAVPASFAQQWLLEGLSSPAGARTSAMYQSVKKRK